MLQENHESREQEVFVKMRNYLPPQLVYYGAVRNLTQSGTSGLLESSTGNGGCSNDSNRKSCLSDRRVKENILCIGKHSLGINLYLFDFKPEYRDQWGHVRQFGVMADEVETVMPEAVSVRPDSYKTVDYAMLGISRNLH